jgi:hypothetical protein
VVTNLVVFTVLAAVAPSGTHARHVHVNAATSEEVS